jgi:hypothetical protein
VNTATGAVEANIFDPGYDELTPRNPVLAATPVVGGKIFLGGLYHHGSLFSSRLGYFRFQTRDPNHFGEVVLGSRAAWNIPYQEDIELTAITQLGCPAAACASNLSPSTSVGQNSESANRIIADNVASQVIMFFRYFDAGVYRLLGVVYDVN